MIKIPEDKKKIAKKLTLLGIVFLFVILGVTLYTLIGTAKIKNKATLITPEQLKTKVESGNVYKCELDSNRIYIYEKDMTNLNTLYTENRDSNSIVSYLTSGDKNTEIISIISNNKIPVIKNQLGSQIMSLTVFTAVLIVIFGIVCMSHNLNIKVLLGMKQDVSVREKHINKLKKKVNVKFSDVAGEDEAKESLQELVDFLHNPKKYTKIGAKLPKGALMVGSPGTGKSLLAKAVAGEANVPFFYKSGAEFMEMYVGVGAQRIRELFKQAKENAPCIVFIDELDAIGKSRDSGGSSSDSEREQTLNQLLTEMDGFEVNNGIIVIGATNRPEVLDKALLRPGRFDRQIIVDKPDLQGRVNILKVHSNKVKMDKSVDFNEIALMTSGCVGADLANMVNEAAINAVRNKRDKVSQKDLKSSIDLVLAGKEKKDRILNQKEKSIVAYHETGHALCGVVQKHTEPVQKITIIPRTNGALGFVMQSPEEEKHLNSKAEMLDRITVCLGGRATEEIVFGKDSVTNGASNDIEQATRLAKAMVQQYGMSDKIGLYGIASIPNQYLGGKAQMDCSNNLADEADKEIQNILKNCYDKAKKIINDNRKALDKLAQYLIKEETITGKEFMKIYNSIKEKK